LNNIAKNPEIYAQRQALVEHPFGTMKRQWGFDHIMTKKSINRASADVGFIFIAYNLKRIMNIVTIEKLMELLAPFLLVSVNFSTIFIIKKAFYSRFKSKSIDLHFFVINPKRLFVLS